MSEEGKKNRQEDDDVLPEHPQESKRYLVFYVIALFSVAMVLVLLSYITQVHAERELATLDNQLQQQVTAVEGAEARLELLQQQVEELTAQLTASEAQAEEEAGKAEYYRNKALALNYLLEASRELEKGNYDRAHVVLDLMKNQFPADRIDGIGEDDLLMKVQAAWYQEMMQAEPPASEEPIEGIPAEVPAP